MGMRCLSRRRKKRCNRCDFCDRLPPYTAATANRVAPNFSVRNRLKKPCAVGIAGRGFSGRAAIATPSLSPARFSTLRKTAERGGSLSCNLCLECFLKHLREVEPALQDGGIKPRRESHGAVDGLVYISKTDSRHIHIDQHGALVFAHGYNMQGSGFGDLFAVLFQAGERDAEKLTRRYKRIIIVRAAGGYIKIGEELSWTNIFLCVYDLGTQTYSMHLSMHHRCEKHEICILRIARCFVFSLFLFRFFILTIFLSGFKSHRPHQIKAGCSEHPVFI